MRIFVVLLIMWLSVNELSTIGRVYLDVCCARSMKDIHTNSSYHMHYDKYMSRRAWMRACMCAVCAPTNVCGFHSMCTHSWLRCDVCMYVYCLCFWNVIWRELIHTIWQIPFNAHIHRHHLTLLRSLSVLLSFFRVQNNFQFDRVEY